MFSLSSPIENGLIVDWVGIEGIWKHAYLNEMHIEPNEQPILISEDP
jgi:actin